MMKLFSPASWFTTRTRPKHTVQEDIELLARYAVETRHRPEVMDEAASFLLKVDGDSVRQQDVDEMAARMKQLMPDNREVTPQTLRATAASDGGTSPTGRYLRWLWTLTLLTVLLRLVIEFTRDAFSLPMLDGEDAPNLRLQYYTLMVMNRFEPFMYGLLGSCVYLMRITGQHLRERTFDPRRIPEHMNRLFLGAVAGGVIVLFIDKPGNIALSAAALGFLAGYSIEFLFRTVDRLIEAILPKVGIDIMARERKTWQQRLEFEIETVERQLATVADPAEKALAEETLGRLKGLLKS